MFGSSVTGLALPKSDVDCTIFDAPGGKGRQQLLADQLQEVLGTRVTSLEVISTARVPLVKFVDSQTGLGVDVSFDIDSGFRTAKLIRRYLKDLPAAKPLILVVKTFLAQRELNETYSGGVGSFMCFLMVISFLQHYARINKLGRAHVKNLNLGILLLQFFDFYGQRLNLAAVGLRLGGEGSFYAKNAVSGRFNPRRPQLLSVENPDEPNMDVGKNSFAVHRVKDAFKHAYHVMAGAVRKNAANAAAATAARAAGGKRVKPVYTSVLRRVIRPNGRLCTRKGV